MRNGNSYLVMTIEPPQPPTAPAPAVRPTPPTPPRIDKTPFEKNSADEESGVDDAPQVTREIETPETMARDAVANGAGSLTKRTVERDDDNQIAAPPTRQENPLPAQVADTQSDYDRGQDVLREFREMDAREAQSAYNPPAQTATEQPRQVTPKLNYHEEHGGLFWIFTIIFVAIAAVVVVKKFLFTGKTEFTKSQLFEDSTDRLKAVEDKVKPVTPPPKPVKIPPKKDDDNKGKHFEVRV